MITVLKKMIIPLLLIFLFKVIYALSVHMTIKEEHYEYNIWQNNTRNDLFTYKQRSYSKMCSCEPIYLYYMNQDENNTIVHLILDRNEELQSINKTLSHEKFLVNYQMNNKSDNSSVLEKEIDITINHQCPTYLNDNIKHSYVIITITFDILNRTDNTTFNYAFDFMKNCEGYSLQGSIISIIILFGFATLSVYFGTKTKLFIDKSEAEPNGKISTTNVLTLAIVGSIMLLSIFHFSNYYAFQIGLTCFIGSQMILSLYLTLKTAYESIVFNKDFPCLRHKIFEIEVYSMIIFVITFFIVVIYFLTKYWFLNNLLAFSLSYVFLLLRHLTNFKECTIFLVVICFYDIFWVYFSPWIFNLNVMEKAATSISLPIKLEMPIIFNDNPLKTCLILGLGDIIIPGFIIKFCKRFDFIKSINVYYKTSLICYIIALTLSGIAAIGFNHPQPVIFFMCFCIIIGVSCLAYLRQELSEIWNADEIERKLLESVKEQPTIIQLSELKNEELDNDLTNKTEFHKHKNQKRKRRKPKHSLDKAGINNKE